MRSTLALISLFEISKNSKVLALFMHSVIRFLLFSLRVGIYCWRIYRVEVG